MRLIAIMAQKDLRLLWRDKVSLFWVLGFPLIMGLFFGSVFSGSGGGGGGTMRIVVTDEVASEFSRDLIAQLDSSLSLTVRRMPADSARERVAKGRLVGHVQITPTADDDAQTFTPGGGLELTIGIDPSRQAEAGYLKGLITQAYFTVLQKQFKDPKVTQDWVSKGKSALDTASDLTPQQRDVLSNLFTGLEGLSTQFDSSMLTEASPFGSPPITVTDVQVNREGPRSAYEISFPQAMIWALIGVTATFAMTIVQERTRGTFLRLRLAPMSRAHVLAGKGLACFTASIVVCAFLIVFGQVTLGVRVMNYTGLAIALVAASICFVGLMMMVSAMGRSEQAVAGASWSVLLLSSMTGGGMIPLVVLPGWMQTVSHISPVKWSILGFEASIWRGYTTPELLPIAGLLIAIGAVAFGIGVFLLNRRDG